jgi:hypothetical protein
MPVNLDDNTAMRIAELLDLFAELPSTPPVLTDEAREFAAQLTEQAAPPGRHRGFGQPVAGEPSARSPR